MSQLLLTSLPLLLSFLLRFNTSHAAWTVNIEPYEESCFVVRTNGPTSRLLTGNYELLDAQLSAEPLLVYIMEDETVVWHSKPNTPFDTFQAIMKEGHKYWLCLQNTSHSPLAAAKGEEEPDHLDEKTRRVGFNYRVNKDPSKPPKIGEHWSDEKTEDWLDVATDLEEDLHDYYDHFDYVKKRESDHRTIVEQTFSDIMTWTLLEAAVVVLSAAGQVFFYRRYLEKKHSFY